MSPETRQQLISAAIELFARRGYEAVSTRELAEAAGVNLGAIQYHFGNKAKLFIDTVRQLMNDTGSQFRELAESPAPANVDEAAIRLCKVIKAFLEEIHSVEKPQGCHLMCREALSHRPDEDGMIHELVNVVVEEFFYPFHLSLVNVLKVLCPKKSSNELGLTAHSIIGQCIFYSIQRPFVEVIHKRKLADESFQKEIQDHICHFSFRALGFSDEVCDKALKSLRGRA